MATEDGNFDSTVKNMHFQKKLQRARIFSLRTFESRDLPASQRQPAAAGVESAGRPAPAGQPAPASRPAMAMAYMAIVYPVYPVYPVRLLLSACMSKKPQFLAKKCHSKKIFAPAARKQRPKNISPAFGRHPSDPHLARS